MQNLMISLTFFSPDNLKLIWSVLFNLALKIHLVIIFFKGHTS